ncbi:MAG: hypothetical protein ABW036_05835 [Flavitalea sp.]
MKFRKLNILAALALGAMMTLTSCSKDDGAIPERVQIEDVPAVTTNITGGTTTTGTITLSDAGAFKGDVTMKMYFDNAVAPTKIDIVARKNGSNATAVVYRADVATLPADFSVTVADIEALFGAPIALNDTYDFAPDIYVGTKKYQAYPITGTPNGQGITGMSAIGYGVQVRFSVK